MENNNIKDLISYKEYNNMPVITFDDIAKVHNISVKTVQSAYNRASDKMNSSIDTFVLKGKDIEDCMNVTSSFQRNQNYPLLLRVFTESGYLNIVKVLNDEVSWNIFKKLKECYFNVKNRVNETKQELTGLEYAEKMLELSTRLLTTEKEKLQLQKQIEHDKPKVETFDAIINSSGLFLVRQVAKMVGTGEHKLFSFLRSNKIIFYNIISERNEPYQKYVDLGYFVLKVGLNKNDPKNRSHSTLYVTAKGIDFIKKEWDKKI